VLKIHKNYVFDENKNPIAIQIPISEFEHLERVIEDYGLSQMMDEVNSDEKLSGDAAKEYYKSLKSDV